MQNSQQNTNKLNPAMCKKLLTIKGYLSQINRVVSTFKKLLNVIYHFNRLKIKMILSIDVENHGQNSTPIHYKKLSVRSREKTAST